MDEKTYYVSGESLQKFSGHIGCRNTVEGESETEAEAGTTVDASEENRDMTVDGGSEAETDSTSTALDTPEEASDKVNGQTCRYRYHR